MSVHVQLQLLKKRLSVTEFKHLLLVQRFQAATVSWPLYPQIKHLDNY